jgi:hypothetical protein
VNARTEQVHWWRWYLQHATGRTRIPPPGEPPTVRDGSRVLRTALVVRGSDGDVTDLGDGRYRVRETGGPVHRRGS